MDVVRLIFCLLTMFLQKSVEAEVEKDGDGIMKFLNQNIPWNYDDTTRYGPGFWNNFWHDCRMYAQSPLWISVNQSRLLSFDPIQCTKCWEDFNNVKMINDGRTVVVKFRSNEYPYLEGGGTGSKYYVEEINFHWGENNSVGTEHKFFHQHQQFGQSMEMHLMLKNRPQYRYNKPSLAVMAVFFQASDRYESSQLKPVVDSLKNILYKGKETTLPRIRLDNFLPPESQRQKFFKYKGSITTPPCTPNVEWILFEKLMWIGAHQMEEFRKLYTTAEGDSNPKRMVHNYRPTQERNHRTIFRNRA